MVSGIYLSEMEMTTAYLTFLSGHVIMEEKGGDRLP
jgi:hypothetical protein